MSLLGAYLILKIDGSVIAETTSVNMLVKAKPLDSTTYDSGMNAEFIGGKVSIAMAGTFLMASSGANWDVLWAAFRLGTAIEVILYRDTTQMFTSTARIVKLRLSGGDSGKLITGGYGLMCSQVVDSMITEDGEYILTEVGEYIIEET